MPLIDWLFDTSLFVPRRVCGSWDPVLIYVWVAASLAIAAAYFSVPLCLTILYVRRRGLSLRGAAKALVPRFALFILLCGLTHVNEAAVFVYPFYRWSAAVLVMTALVSCETALRLWLAMGKILKYRSPEEYEALLKRKKAASKAERKQNKEKEKAIEALRVEVAKRYRTLNMLIDKCDSMSESLRHLSWQTANKSEVDGLLEKLKSLHEEVLREAEDRDDDAAGEGPKGDREAV